MHRSNNCLMGTGIASPKNLISVAVLATLLWQNVSPSSAASLVEINKRGAPKAEFLEPASPLNDYDITLLIDKSRSMTRGLHEIQENCEDGTGYVTAISPSLNTSAKSAKVVRSHTRIETASRRQASHGNHRLPTSHENTGLPPEPEVLQKQADIQNAVAEFAREAKSEEKSEQIDIVQEHRAIIAAEDAALSLKERRALQLERHRQRAARIHEEREAIVRQKSTEREARKLAEANANKFSEYVPYDDSRWAWCQKQAQALSAKLSSMQPDGIRTILFSDDVVENEKSDASEINDLFHTTQPVGATRAAEPLRREFEKYFAQRAANPSQSKPLLVAIITDGHMNDKRAVKMEILRACNQLESGNEILVAFLTVGTEDSVPLFLKELDHLSPVRAKYDIVEVRSFDELDEKGLAGVLEELVTARQKAPIKTAQVR